MLSGDDGLPQGLLGGESFIYLQENCGVELEKARSSLETITTRQDELAAYFCENRNSFRAEECFKIFSNFVARLRVAVQVRRSPRQPQGLI